MPCFWRLAALLAGSKANSMEVNFIPFRRLKLGAGAPIRRPRQVASAPNGLGVGTPGSRGGGAPGGSALSAASEKVTSAYLIVAVHLIKARVQIVAGSALGIALLLLQVLVFLAVSGALVLAAGGAALVATQQCRSATA